MKGELVVRNRPTSIPCCLFMLLFMLLNNTVIVYLYCCLHMLFTYIFVYLCYLYVK